MEWYCEEVQLFRRNYVTGHLGGGFNFLVPVKMKPGLSWRLQDGRDSRAIGFLPRYAVSSGTLHRK